MTPVNQHDCKPSPGKGILADLVNRFPHLSENPASQLNAEKPKAQKAAQMHSVNEIAPGFKPAIDFAADALQDMRTHLVRCGDFDRVNQFDAYGLRGVDRRRK